ncbi:hypothetical protein [Nostoc punctiforme]|nr:hypothetical protein [Nostoc punctiforme]
MLAVIRAAYCRQAFIRIYKIPELFTASVYFQSTNWCFCPISAIG